MFQNKFFQGQGNAMTHDAYWLDTSDHNRLYVNVWLPLAAPKALVMLAHGMAEHSGRYDRLGVALAEAGFALY
ncbi:MAG TPA: alpha/beta hydrolase, partial [Pseudomonas sp.]|nr:alpha/beta hydrolase [Pseudomonas sp.]